mgnify:CR=1 FL=1
MPKDKKKKIAAAIGVLEYLAREGQTIDLSREEATCGSIWAMSSRPIKPESARKIFPWRYSLHLGRG